MQKQDGIYVAICYVQQRKPCVFLSYTSRFRGVFFLTRPLCVCVFIERAIYTLKDGTGEELAGAEAWYRDRVSP